ncbi:phospholipase-like, aminotransferase-like mobile domain protein [Tanacetum coccineum]
MLHKQKVSDNDHYDLPLIYNVNGHTLHFGHCEFCLITGFKFGFNSFSKFKEGDISFRDRVFSEKIGEYVKSIDLLSVSEDEERFISLFDEDSIRVCLLLSLEVIFMGHELGYVVDDVFLRMVDNLEAWNVFCRGEHIWRALYTAIKNVNSKHKDAHHKALEINPNFVPSYSLSRFILCFKIWILESSSVTDHWWRKLSEEIPRGPPPAEYGGIFGDYLKKLSSVHTLKEKDREAWSGTQSSSKEVSLQNRVKALEGLCNSLMILPKEIKSLKACVYKLETIINVITPKTKATHVKHKVNTAGTKDKVESDDCVKSKKQEAKIMLNRLLEQRRLRLQLMLEEENSIKSIDRSNFTHMKLALEKCRTTKRRYVNVLRTPMEVDTEIKGPSMDTLKNQKNVLDAYMIKRCQDLKPWE